MTDLLALAERVEKATGPDRGLDNAIRLATNGGCAFGDDPEHTSSLDAAMTLANDNDITELLFEAMERLGQNGWREGHYRDGLIRHFLAACLRALAAQSPRMTVHYEDGGI